MIRGKVLNKVPEVTLAFWIVKILSTTVGETVADALAVDLGLGLKVTTLIMVFLLTGALIFQFKSRRCVPAVYWSAVVLVSILGTQITDILTDVLEVSLRLSTLAFSFSLAVIFIIWKRLEGTLSIREITTRRREFLYWLAILCTFALGTAAGDLATEDLGLGFRLGAVIFGAGMLVVYLANRLGANTVFAFWLAYILSRPLGAALGDLLSQAKEYGGVGVGAEATSIVFLFLILILVMREQRRSVLLVADGHSKEDRL